MKSIKIFAGGGIVLLLTLPAIAGPRVLVNGVHANPELYPLFAEQDLEQFMQRFPEVDFHIVTAEELPICRTLVTGTLAPGFHSFTVPAETSPLLSFLYVIEYNTGNNWQLPWDYLTDPEENLFLPFENSFIIENPLPGQWVLEITAYPDGGGREVRIGLGPSLFETTPPELFDFHLMLPNFVASLFRGTPPQFTQSETARLDEYFAGGGNLVIARQSGDMAEKPVVQIYDITEPLDWRVDFPGFLTFGEPLIDCITRGRGSDLALTLEPQNQATILYEGMLGQPLRPFTCSPDGAVFNVTNRGADLLYPCLIFQLQENNQVRLLVYPPITPGETALKPDVDLLLTRRDWRVALRETMAQAERDLGLTAAEIAGFEYNWRWTERLDQSLSGEWQGLFLYHTKTYNQLIPLNGEARDETVRLLWHFNSPLSIDQPAGLPFTPDYAHHILPCTVYHEYGFIWDHEFPEQLDQQYFAINFTDIPLIDETDYCGGDWEIAFHSFDTGSPLAAALLEGVTQLCGEVATGINGQGLEFPVTGDDDTRDWGEVFPPGSYPPVIAVDYHGEGAVVGISDQGFLQQAADNNQLMLNMFAALDIPGPSDESWFKCDPPVQELLFDPLTRGDIEFRVVNMGSDTTIVVQEAPSVLWLESGGVTPQQLAPGDTALVEYNVLWESPWLVDGEYDVELPLSPGTGLGLVHAIVSLQQVPPLPDQLRLVRTHPNPFNNRTCLELDLKQDCGLYLDVFNQLGQFLAPFSGRYQLPAGTNTLPLDFNGYANGVYYYRLRFADGSVYHGAVTLLK
ncbi:MAG: hypothetical protein ISR91_06130 [Candidatus Delongbacteria bacterium]|nr:hypothetical protein [Candidatus Delongbacteria bacterium]